MTISWTKKSDEMAQRSRRRAMMTTLGIITGMVLVCFCALINLLSFYLRETDSAAVRLSPRDLRPGECFNELPDRDFLQIVMVIPCDGPHQYETYGRIPIYVDDTGAFPGDEYVTVFANGQCNIAFESYVGVPAGRVPLITSIIKPNADDWTRERRDIICIVSSTDGTPLAEPQFNNRTLSAEINIMAAMEGECLLSPEVGSDNLVTGLAKTTACGQLHDLEVYAVVPVVGQTYPGISTVATFADEQCTTRFEGYVGVPDIQSALGYDTYYPSESAWNNGDRNVICVLLSRTGERLRGSMEGTGEASQSDGTVVVKDLQVGTCYDDTDYSYILSGSVLTRGCEEPHFNELYYRETLPGAADSTTAAAEDLEAAEARCRTEFAAYVGLPYNESVLEFYTISPSNEEWLAGERTHLCVLYERDYRDMTTSMRDSGDQSAWVTRYEGAALVPVADLTVGTCFNDPKDFDYTQPLVTLPCPTPHTNEVFALVDSELNGDYPGEDSLYFSGVEQCKPNFEPYIGLPYEESVLEIYVLFPTQSEWESGLRTLTCLVYDPENFVLDRSVRDSGTATAFPDSGIEGERADLSTLEPGDCIEFPANFDKSNGVLKVDCGTPHEQEVFAVSDFPAPADAPYPDYVDIDTWVAEVCRGAFEGYVGLPYSRSSLDYTYLGLSSAAWERGERNFVCTLIDSTFNPLATSMRDSGEATAFPPDTIPNANRVLLRSLPAESCYYQPVDFYKSNEVLQVDCSAPHGYELYAVEEYPNAEDGNAPYPEFLELTSYADQVCLTAFAEYIGLPFGESALGYTTDYPNEREWAEGDRRVFCLLFGYNYEEFEGLLKGSQR